MKKKFKEQNILRVKEVARFECINYQNVVNIASALAQAGRFVRIINERTGYCVEVYEWA